MSTAVIANARVAGPAVLQVRGVTRSYGGVRALQGVDLEVHAGEIVALLGLNGAGKSTLIRILSGAEQPDGGTLVLDGDGYAPGHPDVARERGLAVVHQQRTLIPHMTVAENVLLGSEPSNAGFIRGRALHRDVAKLAEQYHLKLDVNADVDRLGAGQRQLVDILRGLRSAAKVLLLDEPTAALTLSERETLFELVEQLRSQGMGIVFVSHQMDEVFRISDRIVVLRDGLVVADRIVDEQLPQSVVVDDMIGEMAEGVERVHTLRTPAAAGPVVAQVDGLGDQILVHEGEIIGIAGTAGSGCTGLLEYLAGAHHVPAAALTLRGKPTSLATPTAAVAHRCVLLPEKRPEKGMWARLTIRENVTVGRLDAVSRYGFVNRRHESSWAREATDKLKVTMTGLESRISSLSGGNQQKVVFGRLIQQIQDRRGALFCLDEPTEGVDIRTKPEMYEQIQNLAGQGAALVVASSDLDELLEISDRIYVMRNGAVVAEFDSSASAHKSNPGLKGQLLAAMLSDDATTTAADTPRTPSTPSPSLRKVTSNDRGDTNPT